LKPEILLRKMKKIVLAADLGGTNLRMAAVDRDGKILCRTRRETPRAACASEIVSVISDAAKECLQNFEKQAVSVFAAAVPAIIDFEKGITLQLPNIPALNGFHLAGALENELNLPCILENDANAAAVGENWLGASKDFKNSIMVTLGTGVGGGIIIDGKILRGADGTAGEIGHICVEPFGAPCGCGARGCVEQYASATAIIRLARELESQFPESVIAKKAALSSLEIFEAGRQGDALAAEVFRRQGFYLGIVLADLINVLNPEIVVIGGGAAAGWDLFVPEMSAQIRARAYRGLAERAKIVRAGLGDDAGILGATRLAFERISEMN
jgi:glucokinase